MYTLKLIAKRGSLLGAAGALLVATLLPGVSAFADSLNPLTERSLMLSSSAPGFVDTDGSGNSFAAPNAITENYAPAGSGPNGKKTGETLTFKVSSTKLIKGFSMQYCTTAAGNCRTPGNNTGDADPNRDGSLADSTRQLNETATTGGWANSKSDLNVTSGFTQGTTPGTFQIYVNGTPAAASDWAMTITNKESLAYTGTAPFLGLTGTKNYVELTSVTGETIANGDVVKIEFKPSEAIFITNPGVGAFFVKLNTYDTDVTANMIPGGVTNIDGGVTVANVMTDSIHITTKVLETMAFSVGIRNRDDVTLNCANPALPAAIAAGCEATSGAVHGTCDAVQNINNNRLNLGNPDAEYSLETGKAWDVNSYWRLSSNSSGGATVYYSGDTLRNTVGDHILDMPAESASTPGTEQFGLGFIAPETGSAEYIAEHAGLTISSKPFVTLSTGQDGVAGFAGVAGTQTAAAAYDEATGTLDNGTGGPGTAKFKFKDTSLTIPEMIAQQNTDVITCATAKMRYVGNIAADTPAGVYTTKINYLAAPQY